MDIRYLEIAKRRDERVTDLEKRNWVFAAAVAHTLTVRAQLPSSPVDNTAEWFRDNVFQPTRSLISMLNENIVFNTIEALELVRAMWYIRYNAAHPTVQYGPQTSGYDFFCTVWGAAEFISPETYQCLTQYRREIQELAFMLQGVLSE